MAGKHSESRASRILGTVKEIAQYVAAIIGILGVVISLYAFLHPSQAIVVLQRIVRESVTAQPADIVSETTSAEAGGESPVRPTTEDGALSKLIAVCPHSISYGETVMCATDAAGRSDSYTFAAEAGDVIYVRMSRSSGTLFPSVKVYAPDGSPLCEGRGGSTAEIDGCVLKASGVYTIIAYDYNSGANMGLTGTYGLSLQKLNN